MSLQVWLPAKGSAKNYGVGNATFSGTWGVAMPGGKVTDSYMSNSATYTIYLPSIANSKIWSVCFWGYAVSESITSNWTKVIRIGDGGDMFRVEVCPSSYNSGKNCYSTHNNAAYKIATGSVDAPSGGYYDQWFHFCVTSNGTTISVYHNGTLRGTQNYDGTGAINGYFYLENNAIIRKNDFRIYDHCLSVKEVKEISKGLIVHFPMNDQYSLGALNKVTGTNAQGEFSSGSFTKTKLADERGYHYTYSYTGNGSNSWPNAKVPNYSFTAGKRYFYSMKVRCNTWTAGALYLRASRSDNDWVTSSIEICSNTKADGKWHEYYVSQVVNSTYDRSGTTVTCNPVLEVYCSNLNGNGTVYTFDFDVKDIQVIESDNYVPFIQNDYASNTVVDISGYLNNGTSTTTGIKLINDSPRYEGCYDFTNPAYILYKGIPRNMYYATYTFWVYFKSFTLKT